MTMCYSGALPAGAIDVMNDRLLRTEDHIGVVRSASHLPIAHAAIRVDRGDQQHTQQNSG